MNYNIIQGDALQTLRTLPSCSVQMACTSPPYFGLRDYLTARWEGGDPECDHEPDKTSPSSTLQGGKATQGSAKEFRATCGKCGARRVDNQIGLEESPELYVAKLVEVFREVRRVLHPTGTCWINIGDSYNGSGSTGSLNGIQGTNEGSHKKQTTRVDGLKPKDLIGIPWMLAFALRNDGWYLRSEIIWCLSGGTWVYAMTQKGIMPMMIRDLARLNPAMVRLWNGQKWTQLLGVSKSARKGDELEIVLRSGERISCTPTHRFPTQRGLLDAAEIRVGDILEHCQLPESKVPLTPEHIGDDAAWFAGLYIAEGNRDSKMIQIAGHVRETERFERVKRIAAAYGGSAQATIKGNNMTIRVYGRMLHAILDYLVSGEGAKKKGFSPIVWRYNNQFLSSMLEGYLSGDGHWDAANNRWRLGFTRNYNLERDLRTVCARLGYRLTLNMTSVEYNGGQSPTFRGEIRMERSGHHNEKNMGEVMEIRKARCREVYDLGVEDEPHLFALASGILTHNSKKAPMPESVTDRPTKAHEQLFLLAKSPTYYYDAEAIREPNVGTFNDFPSHARIGNGTGRPRYDPNGQAAAPSGHVGVNEAGRNKRSVWTLGPEQFPGSHFATMPTKLVEPCILAGTSAKGACAKCGSPWARVVEREGYNGAGRADATVYTGLAYKQPQSAPRGPKRNFGESSSTTLDWQPTCPCGADAGVVPCTVLDCFSGAATTGLVALKHGRKYIGLELNEDYITMSHKRLLGVASQQRLFETP